MTGFLLGALILLGVGVAAVVWPLLRGERSAKERRAGALVAIFRDQLRELEAERAAGTVGAEQYEAARRDLERSLANAVAGSAAPAGGPPPSRWTAVATGFFALLTPLVLYLALGNPGALLPGAVTDGAPAGPAGAAAARARPITAEQVQKMIAGLSTQVQKTPGDAQSWAMLARAYAYTKQYPEAVRAYTRAVALLPRDARLLADLADALAMTNGQRLDGEPMRVIERALAIDPHQVKALALAGTQAFDHKQYAKAVEYWERAIKASPSDPEFAQNLRSSVAEARELAGMPPAAPDSAQAAPAVADSAPAEAGASGAAQAAPGPGAAPGARAPAALSAGATASAGERRAAPGGAAVRGRVQLSPALAAKAAPGDTVFVFAKAVQGPRLPLALLRRQVKDLPFDFTLDDSTAMMPDLTISKYSPVIISARVSHSGDAIAAAGDLQGVSAAVGVGGSVGTLLIDQVVR